MLLICCKGRKESLSGQVNVELKKKMNVLSLVKYLIYSVIWDENVSVSINVRLIERKDRGYF